MPTKAAKKTGTKSDKGSKSTSIKSTKTISGKLSTSAKESLSDKTYAFQEKRKEPLENATHVRNALARFNQVKGLTDEESKKAFANIKKAAKKFEVEVSEKSWEELGE